jgi:hypothetical protein
VSELPPVSVCDSRSYLTRKLPEAHLGIQIHHTSPSATTRPEGKYSPILGYLWCWGGADHCTLCQFQNPDKCPGESSTRQKIFTENGSGRRILYHLIQFICPVTCDQNLRNSEFILCLTTRSGCWDCHGFCHDQCHWQAASGK